MATLRPIVIPLPQEGELVMPAGTGTLNPDYDVEQGWHHRNMISADGAQQARDEVMAYGTDAKRAYQRRLDEVNQEQALAARLLKTSPIGEAL